MYKKETIDARTFPQIWASLSLTEKSQIRHELTKNGDFSRGSVYNWSKGARPVSAISREKVANKVGKLLNIHVSYVTLFPMDKKR